MEQPEFPQAKWYSHFGEKLGVSYKVEDAFTISPSNSICNYLPKISEKYVHRKCVRFHQFYHTSQQLKTTQMSINCQMGK